MKIPSLISLFSPGRCAALAAVFVQAVLLTSAPAQENATASAAKTSQPSAQMQAVLDELAALNPKPLETLTPEEARKQPGPADAVGKLIKKRGIDGPQKVADVNDETIKEDRAEVKVRIYTPAGDGPFPLVLYVHGGGWVIADLDSYDASARALCNAAAAVVVSTHYRQAPEHHFPASHSDVFAAYQWMVKNAKDLKGDVNRVAVVGESAGGNMVAGIGIMAVAKGVPKPSHQVLIYPVTDLTTMDTPSYREHAAAKPLDKAMMQWFAQYAVTNAADVKDPALSIVKGGAALKNSPATTVITAEIDPLKSDGDKFVAALKEQGVPVTHRNYEGVTHEFFGMGAVLDTAREAVAFAANQITASFSPKLAPLEKPAKE